MVEITKEKAELISKQFYEQTSDIKGIERYVRGDDVYLTVERQSTGITEYKIKRDNCIETEIEIRDYTDCFIVEVEKEKFIFNGLSEPEKMKKLFQKLKIKFSYSEMTNEFNGRN